MTSTARTSSSSTRAGSGAGGADEKTDVGTGHDHNDTPTAEPETSDAQPPLVDESGPSSGDSIPSTKEAEHPDGQAPEPGPAAGGATTEGGPKPEPADAPRTQLQTTLIILSLASALFLSALDVTIVTVAIPTITEQFNSTAGYTWIGSAYMLATAASAPMWGKFSDIWGRKPILLLAAGVFWVGSLLSAVSVNMAMLIAGRAVQGVGGGGIVILVYICISDLFSMRERSKFIPFVDSSLDSARMSSGGNETETRC